MNSKKIIEYLTWVDIKLQSGGMGFWKTRYIFEGTPRLVTRVEGGSTTLKRSYGANKIPTLYAPHRSSSKTTKLSVKMWDSGKIYQRICEIIVPTKRKKNTSLQYVPHLIGI